MSAVIAQAMSREPGQRPAAAADFGDQLRGLQRGYGFPVDEMALRTEADAGPDEKINGGDAADHGWRRPTAPSTLDATGSLPLELTSFVGRRRELTETKNLVAGSRLVTLTGIGGVGKTRLAMRVATAVQREYPDDVRLVELGEVRDESSLVDAIAGAVGLRDHSPRPVRNILTEFLTPRAMLLVLDNCEHVVDAVAELVSPLLQACPRLRILATSREPLNLDGEATLRVPLWPSRTPSGSPRCGGCLDTMR
ncbi:non-specific serine/threonine protein kinase [Rhodococcus erythropolis]|nr:non-specific serine/threonine protein kinase [Rhodococcus erythropolis]MCW2425464.1 non-specific serine/threonine protein kinase [Rhodococcus erythropolis]